jgi:hypothetical protein
VEALILRSDIISSRTILSLGEGEDPRSMGYWMMSK